MFQVPTVPPSIAAPLIPPPVVVKARLIEAINDVRLLKQLLKVSESAERTILTPTKIPGEVIANAR